MMEYVYLIQTQHVHGLARVEGLAHTLETAKKYAKEMLPKSHVKEIMIKRGIKGRLRHPDGEFKEFMICRYISHPRTGRKKVIFQRKVSGGWR